MDKYFLKIINYLVPLQTDKKTEMRPKKTSIALMLTAVALIVACGYGRPRAALAVADATDGPELPAYGESEDIVRHLGYTASYNHSTLCPDWFHPEELRGSDRRRGVWQLCPPLSCRSHRNGGSPRG